MPRSRQNTSGSYTRYELDQQLGTITVRDGRYAILPVLTVVTTATKREWVIYDMHTGTLEAEGIRFQNVSQAKSFLSTVHPT